MSGLLGVASVLQACMHILRKGKLVGGSGKGTQPRARGRRCGKQRRKAGLRAQVRIAGAVKLSMLRCLGQRGESWWRVGLAAKGSEQQRRLMRARACSCARYIEVSR